MCVSREKMKKLLAIETARAAVVTQWTKKVIVEKQNLANAQNTQEPLVSNPKRFQFVARFIGESIGEGTMLQ
jgi:hypothetical protein